MTKSLGGRNVLSGCQGGIDILFRELRRKISQDERNVLDPSHGGGMSKQIEQGSGHRAYAETAFFGTEGYGWCFRSALLIEKAESEKPNVQISTRRWHKYLCFLDGEV